MTDTRGRWFWAWAETLDSRPMGWKDWFMAALVVSLLVVIGLVIVGAVSTVILLVTQYL